MLSKKSGSSLIIRIGESFKILSAASLSEQNQRPLFKKGMNRPTQ
jgi:hypothetical protein